ncbi:MAG: hypothetical protein QOD02_5491 [Mycobacterium sp.]|jgi:hypothetical protein|nr:hypothetical protein [Mycobacterium sp.]MDT5253468.1 hypothetical protein [Mycobacterium sp.]MDT5277737.1 hypothetical protein [Mycobacterium sp.]MDT5305422.1 hypothetical protein [Mycobacterium sp.]MDT5344227.1 hypothetical protein [Mycobacterium sp.]
MMSAQTQPAAPDAGKPTVVVADDKATALAGLAWSAAADDETFSFDQHDHTTFWLRLYVGILAAVIVALAVALEIPPALLLFPTFPDGALDVLPRSGSVPTLKAREWICGDAPLPLPVHVDGVTGQIARPNVGVGLVGAVARRAATDDHIANLRRTDPGTPEAVESTHRMIESFVEQLSSLKAQITEAQRALWGEADA